MSPRKIKSGSRNRPRTKTQAPAKLEPQSTVIGKQKASAAVEYMASVGDPRTDVAKRALKKASRSITFAGFISKFLPTKQKPIYGITEHQYGYFGIDPESASDELVIKDAGYIKADNALKHKRVRVTLDRLRVAEYPGKGKHMVLVEYSAVHLIPNGAMQDLRFSQKYQVEEATAAGVRGYPIFVGLAVSAEGIALTGRTINVANMDDKGILAFLDQPIFKRGLEMINVVNPALPVVTSMVLSISELLLKRHENIAVQSFDLGLDFSDVPSRAHLREGSYIIVQAPDEGWDWSEWKFTRSTGKLTNKQTKKSIPYNYLVIGVSKM